MSQTDIPPQDRRHESTEAVGVLISQDGKIDSLDKVWNIASFDKEKPAIANPAYMGLECQPRSGSLSESHFPCSTFVLQTYP
jgi:hypothetical protein